MVYSQWIVWAMTLVRSIISILSVPCPKGVFHGALEMDLAFGAGGDQEVAAGGVRLLKRF